MAIVMCSIHCIQTCWCTFSFFHLFFFAYPPMHCSKYISFKNHGMLLVWFTKTSFFPILFFHLSSATPCCTTSSIPLSSLSSLLPLPLILNVRLLCFGVLPVQLLFSSSPSSSTSSTSSSSRFTLGLWFPLKTARGFVSGGIPAILSGPQSSKLALEALNGTCASFRINEILREHSTIKPK